MATKRKGSTRYRSIRSGATHVAENCPICSGRECRVIVASPVDGEFVAELIPMPDGRTRLENASPVSTKNLREIESSGMSGFRWDPRFGDWEQGTRSPEELRRLRRIHLPCATELAMKSLQTWGPANARL